MDTDARYTRWPALVGLAGAALGMTGAAWMVLAGDAVAAAGAAAGGLLIFAALRGRETAPLWGITSLAYGARVIAIPALGPALAALAPDETVYLDVARRVGGLLRGDPVYIGWVSESHLLGTWTFWQGATFALVGFDPSVIRVVIALIGALGCVAAYGLALPLFGRRAALLAALLVGIWPSLFVWSVADLREAPSAVLVLGSFALLAAIGRSPTVVHAVAAFLVVLALGAVRPALAYAAAAAGTVSALGSAARSRPVIVAVAVAASASLAAGVLPTGSGPAPGTFEEARALQARSARTALVPPARGAFPTVTARAGDRLLVWDQATEDPERPISARPDLTPSGREVVVTPPATVALGTVHARPGDIVVGHLDTVAIAVAATERTPRLFLIGARHIREGIDPAEYYRVSLRTPPDPVSQLLVEGAYLPRGIAAAVLAPFLWDARTGADAAAAVETLLWQAALILAVATCWRERRRWRELIGPVIFALAFIAYLALSEGNAGTLFRHRAIVIPIVLTLAAPRLVAVLDRVSAIRR